MKNRDEPAFPFIEKQRDKYGDEWEAVTTGMTLRDYFAAHLPNDFDDLHKDAQYALVGHNPSNNSSQYVTGTHGKEYLKWLAEGRAKWKMMQVEAMISERNKETAPN